MVEIEDEDRIAELCILANYERREHGDCRVVYIRKADELLLRRSGAEIISEGMQGELGDVHFVTFRFKGFAFRYLYSVSEQVANQPTAGKPC